MTNVVDMRRALNARGCPFDCGWAAASVPGDEDPQEKLCIHLRVEHGARPERDEAAWEDGTWADVLFPPEPTFRFPSERGD